MSLYETRHNSDIIYPIKEVLVKPNPFSSKILLVFALAFVLAACATAAPITPPTAAPATAEPSAAPEAEPAITPEEPAGPVSFSQDVMPILDQNCFKCHGGDRTNEGLKLGSYADVMAGSDNGAVVVAGDSAASKLFSAVSSGKMPKRAAKLSDADIQIIRQWIDEGALDN
jgi:mono/diheme cytochrome c family protein